jgi:PAS domain S-box-containing protein
MYVRKDKPMAIDDMDFDTSLENDSGHGPYMIYHSPIATVVSNPKRPDNPIIACNKAFMDLTGYSKKEILGRNCRFLQGPGTDPMQIDMIRDAVAAHRSVLVELINYKKDGTPFRNAVLIAPIFADDGSVEAYLGSQVELADDAPGISASRKVAATNRIRALSPRQREVLEQMARGFMNKQIAYNLSLSEKTVKMHRALLIDRLEVPTSADAVRLAVEAGL